MQAGYNYGELYNDGYDYGELYNDGGLHRDGTDAGAYAGTNARADACTDPVRSIPRCGHVALHNGLCDLRV